MMLHLRRFLHIPLQMSRVIWVMIIILTIVKLHINDVMSGLIILCALVTKMFLQLFVMIAFHKTVMVIPLIGIPTIQR